MDAQDQAATTGYDWSQALAPLPLVEVGGDGTIVEANALYCALLGRSRDELIGRSPVEYTHPDDVRVSSALLASRGSPVDHYEEIEKRYVLPDGTIRWARISATWSAERARMLAYAADIGDLVSARRRREALVEHSADAIVVIERDGRISDMNPAAVALFGRASGSTIEDAIHRRVVGERASETLAGLDAFFAAPGLHPAVTLPFRADSGDVVYLSVVADNQLEDPAIAAVIVNAHDVTHSVTRQAEIEQHQSALVTALVRSTEYRDPYTAGHQVAVAELSRRIARELGLPEQTVEEVSLGASLHDIGKISAPAEILTRPGRLSPPEMDIVRSHCRVGYSILEGSGLPGTVADVVLHHHERLDGSGYPDGLSGEDISLHSRIVAVADVIEAMTSHRPYRPSVGLPRAREEISSGRGRRYDSDVSGAALSVTAGSSRGGGRQGASRRTGTAKRQPPGDDSLRLVRT
ncbi:MAG: HD domain-containing protein [Actinomycetota bacterium]|nr:HD domain-containing protein [Actinomycetota bacterium]